VNPGLDSLPALLVTQVPKSFPNVSGSQTPIDGQMLQFSLKHLTIASFKPGLHVCTIRVVPECTYLHNCVRSLVRWSVQYGLNRLNKVSGLGLFKLTSLAGPSNGAQTRSLRRLWEGSF